MTEPIGTVGLEAVDPKLQRARSAPERDPEKALLLLERQVSDGRQKFTDSTLEYILATHRQRTSEPAAAAEDLPAPLSAPLTTAPADAVDTPAVPPPPALPAKKLIGPRTAAFWMDFGISCEAEALFVRSTQVSERTFSLEPADIERDSFQSFKDGDKVVMRDPTSKHSLGACTHGVVVQEQIEAFGTFSVQWFHAEGKHGRQDHYYLNPEDGANADTVLAKISENGELELQPRRQKELYPADEWFAPTTAPCKADDGHGGDGADGSGGKEPVASATAATGAVAVAAEEGGGGDEDDEDEKVQPRGLFSCLQRSRSAEQPNATAAAAEEPAPAVPSVLTFKEEEAILSWSPPVPVAGECCVCLSTDAPVYKQICG